MGEQPPQSCWFSSYNPILFSFFFCHPDVQEAARSVLGNEAGAINSGSTKRGSGGQREDALSWRSVASMLREAADIYEEHASPATVGGVTYGLQMFLATGLLDCGNSQYLGNPICLENVSRIKSRSWEFLLIANTIFFKDGLLAMKRSPHFRSLK